MKHLGLYLTIISVVGNIYVAHKKIAGLWLWMVSNVGWLYYSYYNGTYDQMPLWFIYLGTTGYSIYQWSKEKKI